MNFFIKLFKTLRTKPWLQSSNRPELAEPAGLRIVPGHIIGLYTFLLVAASLFMLFTVGYQLRMDYQDWRPAPEPWQLWLNTAFLLAGSIAFQFAHNACSRDDYRRVKSLLNMAGVFTWLFLIGQGWGWLVMQQQGYGVNVNPANSFFYLITGVHAAHIAGGLVAWFRATRRLQRNENAENIQLSVKLCTVYWHFLLVVWLFLFYMLLVT